MIFLVFLGVSSSNFYSGLSAYSPSVASSGFFSSSAGVSCRISTSSPFSYSTTYFYSAFYSGLSAIGAAFYYFVSPSAGSVSPSVLSEGLFYSSFPSGESSSTSTSVSTSTCSSILFSRTICFSGRK